MSGSTLLPWLLVGPILLGGASCAAWRATGLAIFATIGKACAAMAGAVVVIAFVAARLDLRRRSRRLR